MELNSRVRAVRSQPGGRYVVELDDRTYEAQQVVIATGPFQAPFVPPIAEGLDASVVQMHSTAYRSPESIPAGRVLVVGGGNTGFQIAEELSASREVHLSIGSRQMPLPQRVLGRDLFWYLDKTGLIRKTTDVPHRPSDVSSARHAHRLHATCDCGGTVSSFMDEPVSAAGSTLTVRRRRRDGSDRRHLGHRLPGRPFVDRRAGVRRRRPGRARARRDCRRRVSTSSGLLWQHTRGSALLGWVKDDAEYLAERIEALRADAPSPETEIAGAP